MLRNIKNKKLEFVDCINIRGNLRDIKYYENNTFIQKKILGCSDESYAIFKSNLANLIVAANNSLEDSWDILLTYSYTLCFTIKYKELDVFSPTHGHEYLIKDTLAFLPISIDNADTFRLGALALFCMSPTYTQYLIGHIHPHCSTDSNLYKYKGYLDEKIVCTGKSGIGTLLGEVNTNSGLVDIETFEGLFNTISFELLKEDTSGAYGSARLGQLLIYVASKQSSNRSEVSMHRDYSETSSALIVLLNKEDINLQETDEGYTVSIKNWESYSEAMIEQAKEDESYELLVEYKDDTVYTYVPQDIQEGINNVTIPYTVIFRNDFLHGKLRKTKKELSIYKRREVQQVTIGTVALHPKLKVSTENYLTSVLNQNIRKC